ncbi:MAG TPA: GspE/PulE family protein [Candidatus Sumerlaeota bacterium]|nr:GspE/PulE family protein [Candidatus Sumerlaeota bacterium]HPS03036.1 GspE/PulE family protein [Candidatus Sumerlaeota bacterium]
MEHPSPAPSTGETLARQIQPLIDALPRDDNRAVAAVDLLLREALARRASDLHLECKRDGMLVKMRLDGRLHVAARLGLDWRDALLTRLKVMARLIVYRTRTPQDGRLEVEWEGRPVPCRVSTLPTLHGEKVVVRLAESRQAEMNLRDLGMDEDLQDRVGRLLDASQGALLLTGPASSGKTTTIYAMLRAIHQRRGESANIVTLEDPIEADLGIVSQTQVEAEQGLTFESGLRSLLRQDPEVIMIGEIRDAATAQIAIQAALTGHLLISTVHSGRAPGVFVRLIHMGVEPFLAASAIRAVLAQRLVRRLCPDCRQPRSSREQGPLPAPFDTLETWWEPQGCPRCASIGLQGRIALFETLEVDDPLRELILERAPEVRFRELLDAQGWEGLTRDAKAKIAHGLTSPQEAMLCLA